MLGARKVAFVVAAVIGLLMVPVAGARSAPTLHFVGEEFGAPYDMAFTGTDCSTRLTCEERREADRGTGALAAEITARPNPGSVNGSGSADAWSQVQAWIASPTSVAGLKVTAEVRLLAGSAVSADAPSSFGEVAATLAVWHDRCDKCQGFTYRRVLTASVLDSAPSSLSEDLTLTLVAELRRADGAPVAPGRFRVAPMVFTHVGHSTVPTIGKVGARAAMVVERIKTEVLPA